MLPANFNHPFWKNVEFIPEHGCWEWTAGKYPCKSNLNYGKYNPIKDRKPTREFPTKLAHRISLMLSGVQVPSHLVVDHKCKNTTCVNPDHLRVVTQRENVLAMNSNSPAAINFRMTHCRKGHILSGANLDSQKNGRRRCKTCHKIREKKYYLQKREI